jgi:EF-hand domain
MQVGVPLRALFKALDNDGDGRIDGLELIGGLALCCRGTFEASHLPDTNCHYIIMLPISICQKGSQARSEFVKGHSSMLA